MNRLGLAARVAVLSSVSWTGACGGAGSSDTVECESGAIGLAAPPCTCLSWTNYVSLGTCGRSDCVRLTPDLSTSPAHATVRVGQGFVVGSGHENGRPAGCNDGGWNNRPTWTASDPSVLRLEATAPAGFSTATFRAIAPGTSTVTAEDLLTPGGQIQRVGLTACAQEVKVGFGYECTQRVPLEIRVVP